jgi:uncharacterized membrane protein
MASSNETKKETHTGELAMVNVSQPERWTAAVSGVALTVIGLRRRSILGTVLVATGGILLVRAAMPTDRRRSTRRALAGSRGITVDQSVTIARAHDELYRFWRDFENLPDFMEYLVGVRVLNARRSRWVARAPAGRTVQWDAEIINDEPDELIAWRTLEGSDVISAGSVHFTPTSRGETIVRVRMQYEPPAGKIGAAIAWMFGTEPSQSIREDLRRFKALMEAGEVPTTAGEPRGRQSILNYD